MDSSLAPGSENGFCSENIVLNWHVDIHNIFESYGPTGASILPSALQWPEYPYIEGLKMVCCMRRKAK